MARDFARGWLPLVKPYSAYLEFSQLAGPWMMMFLPVSSLAREEANQAQPPLRYATLVVVAREVYGAALMLI